MSEKLCNFYEKIGDNCTKFPESGMMCAWLENEQPRCKWYTSDIPVVSNPL